MKRRLFVDFKEVKSRAIRCRPIKDSIMTKRVPPNCKIFWKRPYGGELAESLKEIGIEYLEYPKNHLCEFCGHFSSSPSAYEKHVAQHLVKEKLVDGGLAFDVYGYYYLCKFCKRMTARVDECKSHLARCLGRTVSLKAVEREYEAMKDRGYVLWVVCYLVGYFC